MKHVILNNKAVKIMIFDKNNEIIQIIFQSYISESLKNK